VQIFNRISSGNILKQKNPYKFTRAAAENANVSKIKQEIKLNRIRRTVKCVFEINFLPAAVSFED